MKASAKRILIIDDDDKNIFALSATLKVKGYECISFSDTREGLTFLEGKERVDIVLLDMMMPEMDGYEALSKIKALLHRRKIPIIAVTAQAMMGDKEKCIEAGADEYIAKPIDVDRLLFLLNTLAS